MPFQETDQELLPPPPKKTKSLGEELLPPPPKKKENLGLNELPTPSVNGLSGTQKAEKFEGALPAGQLPSVKNTLEKYGIKAPVIPKEQDINQPVTTEVVQPKIKASYDDFVAHNEERKVKHGKLVDEAIENSAKKVLKNKGVIKPEEEGKELNLSQYAQLSTEKFRLREAYETGDATFAISKEGEPGLMKTVGFQDALVKGWNQATKGNEDAATFAGLDAAGKVDFLKKQQAEQTQLSEYLGERPSEFASMGQLAGENAPFLEKAIIGGATGTAMVLTAPETMGASLAGLPAAMSFIFTANDSKNQGIYQEVTRRFQKINEQQAQQLKENNVGISDHEIAQILDANAVPNMQEAEKGAIPGMLAGVATNAALMSSVKTPLSNLAKGVVGKSIMKAASNTVYGSAAVATIEAAKSAEGNLEGIKATPAEIAKEWGKNFVETASTLALLHAMTGVATKVLTLPNIIKSSFKWALKDVPPTEIQSTLKANVDAGTITPEAAEKVTTDLEQYKAAVAKTPNGLSSEAEASVAGLIQAKDKLIAEMKTKDDTAKPFYEEKIAGINEQIQKTVNTGKPYAHEIDEISGEKYTEQKPKEQPQPEVIEPSTEVKSEEVKKDENYDNHLKTFSEKAKENSSKNKDETYYIYEHDVEKPLRQQKSFDEIVPKETVKVVDYNYGELDRKTDENKKGFKLLKEFRNGEEVKSEPQPSTVKSEEVGSNKLNVNTDKIRKGRTNSIEFKTPILGKNGAKLLSYTWESNTVGKDKDGKPIRISDWSKAGVNADTGRGIVHKFKVEIDGKVIEVSADSVAKALGFTDAEMEKAFSKAKDFVKQLAKLKMKEQGLLNLLDEGREAIDKAVKKVSDKFGVKIEVREGETNVNPAYMGMPKEDVKIGDSDAASLVREELRGTETTFTEIIKIGDELINTRRAIENKRKQSSQFGEIDFTEEKPSAETKSENKPIQQTKEVSPEISKLETERDTKIKELEKVEVPKLEYVKEDDLVNMKNETELIEEQRAIKKRESQLKQLIKCLTGL